VVVGKDPTLVIPFEIHGAFTPPEVMEQVTFSAKDVGIFNLADTEMVFDSCDCLFELAHDVLLRPLVYELDSKSGVFQIKGVGYNFGAGGLHP
jgi:hypothetical protein